MSTTLPLCQSTHAVRVAHIVTHPIQYFTPLYRAMSKIDDIDLTVWFGSDFGTVPSHDADLATTVQYDVDLTGGFKHSFLQNRGDGRPDANRNSYDCPNLDQQLDPSMVDVVWIHGWGYLLQHQAAEWAVRHNVPYIIRGESTLLEAPQWSPRWLRRWLKYSRFCRRASACLYVGSQNRNFFRSLGVSDDRLFPAHYSVDTAAFSANGSSTDERREIRTRNTAMDQDIVLITVCKLIPRKRVGDLIRVLERCGENIKLWIIGAGIQEASLRELASKHARDRVTFLGFKNQTELPKILSSADLFVLASGEETWGLVANEAMACGLPVLISDRCGCASDLVVANQTGSTFLCGDLGSLSQKIKRLAGAPQALRAMGCNASDLVRSHYSVQCTAEQIATATIEIRSRKLASSNVQ